MQEFQPSTTRPGHKAYFTIRHKAYFANLLHGQTCRQSLIFSDFGLRSGYAKTMVH